MIPAVEELRVEAGQADSMIQGGTERILLVDDEEAIVNSLTMILTNIGYTVDGFTQAGAALRQFRNTPGAYDLVITDYSMPRMTGIDLAREIRRIRADIPMILSSGYLNREMGETAFDAGIGDILTKPVGTYRLTETIRKALSSSKEADPPIR
jgi:DNA-binding NtrC family response regulator